VANPVSLSAVAAGDLKIAFRAILRELLKCHLRSAASLNRPIAFDGGYHSSCLGARNVRLGWRPLGEWPLPAQSGRLARSEVICVVWSGLPGHWIDSLDSGIGHSIPSFSEIIRGIAIQRYSRIRTGRQVPDNCRFHRLRCGRRSGGKMS
jgi:hypothetical protein